MPQFIHSSVHGHLICTPPPFFFCLFQCCWEPPCIYLSVCISLVGGQKACSNPLVLRLLPEFILKWSQSQCVTSVRVCEGLGQRVTL